MMVDNFSTLQMGEATKIPKKKKKCSLLSSLKLLWSGLEEIATFSYFLPSLGKPWERVPDLKWVGFFVPLSSWKGSDGN